MCASALPGEIGKHEIRVELNQKRQENIPDIIDCNLKKDNQILIVFGTSIPDRTVHQMTIQVPTSPSVCICTTWKSRTSEICVEINIKNVNKFHFSGSVAPNSSDLRPFAYNVCGVMQQRVYWTLFRNADEPKKRLVEVWSRTLLTLLSLNGECICVPAFAQKADVSNIYCKQLNNWAF